MLRLLLLRHAKSDWANPELADRDRPLSKRGQAAAEAMACYIIEHRLFPDLILCSSAQRTRETLLPLLSRIRREVDIRVLHSLYDQSEENYLPIIQAHGAGAQTLMIIGHNPATENTARTLFGAGSQDLKRDMELKYPSGALAVYSSPKTETWSALAPGESQLDGFVKPRDLPQGAQS
jgi:phosphohistidine phosphatase